MNRILLVIALSASALAAGPAHAKLKIFSGSAGVLITAGGDLWTKPEQSGSISLDDAVPFSDTAGGYGVGGGIFFEARFIRYLGLELDLLFEHNDQWYEVEVSGTNADVKFHLKYLDIRLPILVKAVIPTSAMRFSIGLGPELVFSRNARAEEERSGAAFPGNFSTREQTDVFLCTAIGFAIKVWKLSIPLNLRFAYNTTQPKKAEKRLDYEISGGSISSINPTASQTMDLRLMIGLAYDF
jgi:hypothetical protein